MKTYIAEIVNDAPRKPRILQDQEPLPLGVILTMPDDNVRIILTIPFVTYYGRKYSAELRGEVKPQDDPTKKLKSSIKPTAKCATCNIAYLWHHAGDIPARYAKVCRDFKPKTKILSRKKKAPDGIR